MTHQQAHGLMKYGFLFFMRVGLLTLAACVSTYAESTFEPTGYWTGVLEYRGADLEVRVHIRQEDHQFVGRLDIPALVYADQPFIISYDDMKSVSLELPFGIGPLDATAVGPDQLRGSRDGLSVSLQRAEAPEFVQTELRFGAFEPKLQGTVYLPPHKGPHPLVVLIAGSGTTRKDWSYASWVNFYLDMGVGAFVYERRPDLEPLSNGSLAGIEENAADVADAVRQLRSQKGIDADRIGLAGSSRGAWIAMAVARRIPDCAFMVLISPSAATPGEQETTSVLTGMRQDGLDSASLAQARAYLRLYFYVAQTGQGWDLLSASISAGQDSDWLQYVDQPRTLKDLGWWRNNMNFDAISHLENIKIPVLALWGGDDFITPWADYRLKLESALRAGGNTDVTVKVFNGADHRLEVGPGENNQGEWQWFGLAPGALESIRRFVHRATRWQRVN